MKLTIEGSSLANYMKPLAVKVRQHEGTDYDRISMAITEMDGRKYLNARVEQPTYRVCMHLNLSGVTRQTADGQQVNIGDIDLQAVPCGSDMQYVLKSSDMSSINRALGTATGEYAFDGEKGLTVQAGKTRLHKDCICNHVQFSVPFAVEKADGRIISGGGFVPMGHVNAVRLSGALDSAIRMCSLSGSKGELRARAIHLTQGEKTMTVEAISHNGAVVYPVFNDIYTSKAADAVEGIHLAISLESARVLLLMCSLSGGCMYWSYDSVSKEFTFCSCDYSIIIDTEKVSECIIPELGSDDKCTMTMKRLDLISAVRRVKMAGLGTLNISSEDEALLDVDSSDYAVQNAVNMTFDGMYQTFTGITLPADTLLAALNPFGTDDVCLGYDYQSGFITLSNDSGVRAVVYEV